jgi:hypothetical protein
MAAIAQRYIATVLASAEIDRLGFDGIPFHRGEFRALVAAVTKRLLAALSASAPEIAFAAFDGYWKWRFLSYRRAGHEVSPIVLFDSSYWSVARIKLHRGNNDWHMRLASDDDTPAER